MAQTAVEHRGRLLNWYHISIELLLPYWYLGIAHLEATPYFATWILHPIILVNALLQQYTRWKSQSESRFVWNCRINSFCQTSKYQLINYSSRRGKWNEVSSAVFVVLESKLGSWHFSFGKSSKPSAYPFLRFGSEFVWRMKLLG